jgi:hypothetical protein
VFFRSFNEVLSVVEHEGGLLVVAHLVLGDFVAHFVREPAPLFFERKVRFEKRQAQVESEDPPGNEDPREPGRKEMPALRDGANLGFGEIRERDQRSEMRVVLPQRFDVGVVHSIHPRFTAVVDVHQRVEVLYARLKATVMVEVERLSWSRHDAR